MKDGEATRWVVGHRDSSGIPLRADVLRGDLPTDGVPIVPAATVLLLADRPDLHVLALRRTDRSTFVAGHTLFPGGAVEDGDHDARWDDLAVVPDGESVALVDPRAFRLAAVRETVEEVGIALGVDEPSLAAGMVDRRDDLQSGRIGLRHLVADSGARLDLTVLHPVARWITPMPSNKRYDAAFFVARCPAGAEPVVDGREAVHAEWCRPADALARWEDGELTMISPTVAMFQLLAVHQTVASVLAAAAAPGRGRQASVLDESADRVLFDGDEGFDDPARRLAMGWAWLEPGPIP
ncbi:MAG: NUDIX hydrolase [Actinomycetota bacterium]|nr:NUDIX hydrolase [Actinomycetota bacterium]